jgi:uncharacterized delta-60 repeat protein
MRKHILRSALIIALLTIIGPSFGTAQAAPLAAYPAPGDLDTTFAGFGTAGIVNETALERAKGMAVQPDGKIVVVGYAATMVQLEVFRYLPNGRRDPTFGNNGRASFPNMFSAVDVAIQSDGRIVVGGTRHEHRQLARLTPSGTLDQTFGGDGWVEGPQIIDFFGALLVQADGKIVACGHTGTVKGDIKDFRVTRYNADGSPDTAFGGGGEVMINFGAQDFCEDVVQQPDGKLVVVGTRRPEGNTSGDSDFAVARLNTDGSLDTSFDNDGKLTTGFGGTDNATSVALQSDGKIVVLGPSGSSFSTLVARYLPNGALDGTFDGDGKLTVATDRLSELVLQPDGKLLALGYHKSPDGDTKFALHRLLPSGANDTTFGENGRRFLDFGGIDDGTALALLPDGRILAAGTNGTTAVLVRLWPDGTTIDTGGQQTHGLASLSRYQPVLREYTYGMALKPGSLFGTYQMLVTGRAYDPNRDASDAFVSQFDQDGQPASGFGINGSARISMGRHAVPQAIVLQPDGKIVIAGYSAFDSQYTVMDFMVIRLNQNGAPDTSFGLNGMVLVDFAGGADGATALALAPDGKIVVAGNVWNGVRYDWGVMRLTTTGQPDPTFGNGGKLTLGLGVDNGLQALALQADGKILLAGQMNKNFAVARLQLNGQIDLRFGVNGYAINDLGGTETISALKVAPSGWFYAAGVRIQNGNADMALAQYTPNGALPTCTDCEGWPNGTFFFDAGTNDYAYALDLRDDNQLVAAGCSNQHFAAVQVPTDGPPTPLVFNTDFVGIPDCAHAVKFIDAKIVMAGEQNSWPFANDTNIALARFQTTPQTVSTVRSPTNEATTQDTTVPTPPPDQLVSETVTLSETVSSGVAQP